MVAMKLPESRELPLTLAVGEELTDELDTIRYRIDDFLARGGMGEVYDATRLSDGARVAVKCVRYDFVTNPTVLLRSRFEAQAFRKIDHPNVVPVYGTGVRGNNVPWMAMKRLRGFSLEQVIELRGKIPLRWAIELVRDLCLGLHPIHKYAIHRDIKPSNLHLGFDTVLRVLDLGVAKSKEPNIHLTTTGYQLGTLPYMAPEQLENNADIDHRADLWAAIVVLYILVTGVHPFAPPGGMPLNKVRLGYSILQDPHRPLTSALEGAPPWLDQVVDRGLAKDPEHRHRSAQELAEVLTAALDYLQTKTRHAEPLSSLIEQLCGGKPPPVDEPARLIRTAPRTTEPMPPPARNAEPMPPPASGSKLRQASGKAAPEQPHATGSTNEMTNADARPAIVPAPAVSSAPVDERSTQDDGETSKPRESDVRVRRTPAPGPTPQPSTPQQAAAALTAGGNPPHPPAQRNLPEDAPALPEVAPALADPLAPHVALATPGSRVDPRRRVVAAPSAAAIAEAPPATPLSRDGSSAPTSPPAIVPQAAAHVTTAGDLPAGDPPAAATLPARQSASLKRPTPTAHDAPAQEVVPPQESHPERGGARRGLGEASLFGAPRWFVVLCSASAVVTSAELLYFFGPHVSPRTGPVEIPASSLPTRTDEPPPVPVAERIESSQAVPPQAPPPEAVQPAQEVAPATAAPSALPARGPVHTAAPAPTASVRKPTPAPPSPKPTPTPPPPAPSAPASHRIFGTEN